METRKIEYGTQHHVEVVSATNSLITVVDESGEGYLLLNHGMKILPKIGEKGRIVFMKSDTLFNGYCKYECGLKLNI